MPALIETFLYLRFHLCSLFWVNCQDMLVMADGEIASEMTIDEATEDNMLKAAIGK